MARAVIVAAERQIVVSPSAAVRVDRASAWLESRGLAEEVLLVGFGSEAPSDLARPAAAKRGAAFGWHRMSFGRLAATLAGPALARRGLVPVGGVALDALAARVVHKLAERDELGRFTRVADRPGLARAIARTVSDLRAGGVTRDRLEDVDLARAFDVYLEELEALRLADRPLVFRFAIEAVDEKDSPFAGLPLLLLDLAVESALEHDLVSALAQKAPSTFACAPAGDERTLANLVSALPGATVERPQLDATSTVSRLQQGLFAGAVESSAGPVGDDVVILSAPGENRECVEIARRIHQEAERGVPFDRMAILLRSAGPYRSHLGEALRRADVPAYFARGTVEPDPSGRAFLSLLACAAEDLSARRFSEYLSLGEVPDAENGAPPAPKPSAECWVAPDEEMLPASVARAEVQRRESLAESEEGNLAESSLPDAAIGERPVVMGTLRAPRLWERIIVDAAVIGGRDRWTRRLAGQKNRLLAQRTELEADDPRRERFARDVQALDGLVAFAMPLLDALSLLPAAASWGTWLEHLSSLATRALRRPERVLATLAELSPMSDMGPVALREVRLTLHKRLTELVAPPPKRKAGRVYVGLASEARGLSFDVVFIPGLAEKMFPLKVTEDPIFRDAARRAVDKSLWVREDRVASERLALRLATGCARQRVFLSYPRLDAELARPRTPSFYGLEVLRAAEGKLPGFDELTRRAEQACPARLGWPAPENPRDAIDEAEHDLALLATVFRRPAEETTGMARFLLSANPHLARALRGRYARWDMVPFKKQDGLVDPEPPAARALAEHQLAKRSFSPTALQHFASCPYRFLLYAVLKLAPREEPEALEELDALQKGSLVHETLFELHLELKRDGLLPVRNAPYEEVRTRLSRVLARVAARFHDNLAPAIERVWEDGITNIKADLLEWLRLSVRDLAWTPTNFELAFGPIPDRDGRDPASVDEPVMLDCGIQLRGSIDLVEENGHGEVRATDYKTGRTKAKPGAIIQGGEILQPVFYALALEKLLPGRRIDSGRLWYCTAAGDYRDVTMQLDDQARDSARAVAEAVGAALRDAFLPQYPAKGACEYCDYRVVCGPYEEQRTAKKRSEKTRGLVELRRRP